LNQTIDLNQESHIPVKKRYKIIENFLFCFSLDINSFPCNRKERKLQL